MGINQIENGSCTIQIVREAFNISITRNVKKFLIFRYDSSKNDPLINFASQMMKEHSIPIISVDLLDTTDDFIFRNGMRIYDKFTIYAW